MPLPELLPPLPWCPPPVQQLLLWSVPAWKNRRMLQVLLQLQVL